jgi:peptide/nickel transport system substrate-binding protein
MVGEGLRAMDGDTRPRDAFGLRLTRRRFASLAAGAAATTLLAACGGDDDDDDEPPTSAPATATLSGGAAATATTAPSGTTAPADSATPTTAASEATSTPATTAEEPKSGGTLIYATNIDAKTLDPHFSAQFSERYMLYLIYNTIVAYDKDFNIGPDLAESWDIDDDGLGITFHLREGVTFHDGTTCDAEAVNWNLERILNPEINSPMRSQLEPAIESIEVVDPLTIKLNLKLAWRPILASLGERPGFVVSPAAVEQYGEEFGLNPVGSGPFKFVEWVPDGRIVVERNEDYWDTGKPYLDGIEMRHVAEGQVELTMIRTGEAHLIDAISPTLLETLEGADDVVVEELQSARFAGVRMDVDKPPFDNADLRKAIAYATDREELKRVIYNDTGRVATHPLGGGWAYNPELDGEGYTFDLDKAREHLEASGMAGQTLTFTSSNDQATLTLVQLLQAQYQQLDLTIEIETVESADQFALEKEDKIAWNTTTWAPRADPDGLIRILWHSQGFQNTTGYNNPEVDKLIDETATIYDTDRAKEIYTEIERIVTSDASFVFTHWPSVFAARRASVKNFVYHPDLILRMRELWLDE